MTAPAPYYDSIRVATAAQRSALDAFRHECGAPLLAHRSAIDLAAFEDDGAPVAAVRLCLDVDACLCGLAIAASRLRSALPYRLARAWYELALERGARHATAPDGGPHVDLLKALGFMASEARPGTLRLGLQDVEHLRRVNSPFLPSYERWRQRPGSAHTGS
jgi:hypothetical protein